MLPHLNAGVMSAEELSSLRPVSVSQGLMLETSAERLCRQGRAALRLARQAPAVRLDVIRAAGEAPYRSPPGILIGIGETRRERLEALLALRESARRDMGTFRKSLFRIFAPSPARRWQADPEPASKSICGPSRRRGSCSARR